MAEVSDRVLQTLEQKRKWIQEFDSAQSEMRSKRIIEIESPELVGKGYPP